MGIAFSRRDAEARQLNAAFQDDEAQVALALVLARPSLLQGGRDGSTSFHRCIEHRAHTTLRELLRLVAPRSSSGRPARMSPVSPRIVSQGRLVDGATPLMLACALGDDVAVGLLLAHGADPWSRDTPHRRTCLHYAAEGGHASVVCAVVEASRLQGSGSRVSAAHLQLAADLSNGTIRGGGSESVAAAAAPASIQRLSAQVGRALVDMATTGGQTPLMYAAQGGHAACVRALLDCNASLNKSCWNSADPVCNDCCVGAAPLHAAAHVGATDAAWAMMRRDVFGGMPLIADRGQMITIVSAYSPTEAASDEEAGDFYLRVAALADKANDKRDLLIVAGGSQRRAWDSSQLRRPAVRREFNLQLSDRFGLLEAVPPEGADAQAEYDAMAAAIREVATNHLAPRGSRRRRGWQFTLSQRTLRLMDARQRAHTAWLRSKSAAAKRERNRANRAADAAVQRDRERWIGQQVAEAQDMLRKKNLRQFARACDRLAGRSRSHQIPPAMRDVSGALHSGPDGVLKAMTESFDKLYGGETKLSDETLNQLENDVAAFELTRATEVDEAHGRPPDLAETEACVRALRSAAAPGG
ncbi:hypothetical protein FOA52_003665 [Chlamydomonas sp. UWO 241]|nr:hypothetical protein FOA52_003665 [Chlamydomonas sp. UWO 241]